ncbi:MAG TPA: hypothetical protein VMB26_13285, partial [Candidatus Binataceae bacterium]|nr:hypothetical protein [Candidatus Binataceae bacterium]
MFILLGFRPTLAQAINPVQQDIDLPGSPFAAAVSVDGQYVFASLSGGANGIAIIKQGPKTASLIRRHSGCVASIISVC